MLSTIDILTIQNIPKGLADGDYGGGGGDGSEYASAVLSGQGHNPILTVDF